MSEESIKEAIKDAWLGVDFSDKVLIKPLDLIKHENADEVYKRLLWLMSRPEYLAFTVKILMGIDLLPFQAVILAELWNHKFPMFIGNRGCGKSYLLSIYAILRAVLIPGRKIVIVGSAFRQSKILFDYIESIWWASPVLRSICDGKSGPRKDPDVYKMQINTSRIISLPIGDGSKIRGQRAQDIISDEFASLPIDIFENVIAGFASVSSAPADNVRAIASRKKAIELGEEVQSKDQMVLSRTNQIVISGTAFYDFNHFATYWKKWKAIVNSKGDKIKLREVFNGEVPKDFNYADYMVIRMPYDMLPEGFMDEGQISRSKATIHSGIFDMEFKSCNHPDTLIITKNGLKKIIDISVGDEVLTHKGRFKKVEKRTFLHKNGDVIRFNTYGCFQDLVLTPEHPLYVGNDKFEEAFDVEDNLFLSRIKELSGLSSIDLTSRTHDYITREDYIYPKSSKNLIDNEMTQKIISMEKSNFSVREISVETGVSEMNIYSMRRFKKPKKAIKRIVNLDYDMGIIFGYYVSEGSGTKDRTISFALDGHVDVSMQAMILQLKKAIESSFDTYTQEYVNDNMIIVCICSRIIHDFIKSVCPGVCYDKIMEHDILFSNVEFMKGYVIGLFNGDGHKREEFAVITVTNINIINQLRMVLTFFGITSNIYTSQPPSSKFRDKEYESSRTYKLQITGTHYDKFLSLFFPDFERAASHKSSFLKMDDECLISPIRSKTIEHYEGFVYNLEVEDDNSYSTINATMHNCFSKDSLGFFKRSLIEKCTPKYNQPIIMDDGEEVLFEPSLMGEYGVQHVIGCDPASEVDNFSLVVIAIHPNHRRIKYVWTTNRKDFIERKKHGSVDEDEFYGFCARKIRNLMKYFNTSRVAIDAQGGGIAVFGALHDKKKLKEGEIPFWTVIDMEKPDEYAGESGLHIIQLCQFANYKWLSEANHEMRLDFEHRKLLFPAFDPISVGLSAEEDAILNRKFDTMEELVVEIEELKNELSIIEISQSEAGRDKWSTPAVKLAGSKKGYLRKDRYSALLMANKCARDLDKIRDVNYESYGGFSKTSSEKPSGNGYYGPAWFTERMNGVY